MADSVRIYANSVILEAIISPSYADTVTLLLSLITPCAGVCLCVSYFNKELIPHYANKCSISLLSVIFLPQISRYVGLRML